MKRILTIAFTVAWIFSGSVPIGLLMAKHLVPIPPGAAMPATDTKGHWTVVHFLVQVCACSDMLSKRLLTEEVAEGIEQRLILIGEVDGDLGGWTKSGFELEVVSAAQAREIYGIRGGPRLVIFDPAGQVAYSGGYNMRLPAVEREFLHPEIIEMTMKGELEKAYPVYGCMSDPELTTRLRPFRSRRAGHPQGNSD